MEDEKLVGDEKLMKVILPASEIPLGSIVTKIRGEIQYLLDDSVKIYYTDKMMGENIKIDKNCRVLIRDFNSSINVIPDNIELVWLVDEYDLYYHLKTIIGE